MEHLNSMQDLFVHELKDLYSAEKQLTEALPKMANAASSTVLREAFEQHLMQTRNHIDRLDRIFSMMNTSHEGHECKGMKGLIEEGEEVIKMQGDATAKDAALIGAAQRVEHYEIAGYGTARTHAEQLNFDDVADLLQDTLDEEGETNKKLTKIAEGGLITTGVNEQAVRG